MSLPVAFVVAALLAVSSPGHPQRDRADASFSAIPLGVTRPPSELGLRELGAQSCRRFQECDWADDRGVRHYFWEDDELVVKRVLAEEVGDRPIAALGIGRARNRGEVLAAVQAFLPDAELDCARYGDAVAPVTICTGALDEGWLRLWFDGADKLTEVRLDARHFT